MAKTLRILSDPDFTTKGNTLTWEELDQNQIDIWNEAKAAVDNLGDLGITATASELNILDGASLSTAELNLLDGVSATTAELNQLDGNDFTSGITGTTADFSGALDADTLRTDTGKFLSPTSYQFRNAGDTGFRDVEMAGLTANNVIHSPAQSDNIRLRLTAHSSGGVSPSITWFESDDTTTRSFIQSQDDRFRIVARASGQHHYLEDGDVNIVGGTLIGEDADFSSSLDVGDDTHLQGALTVDLDSAFKDDIQYNTLIKSQNFADAAGIFTGFQLGQSEFKAETIRANELRVKAFVAEISAALYGEDILTKSRGVLTRDFTVPAVGNTSTLYVEDLEGLENTQVFEANDWVRLRVVDRSGGGLQVFNVWGKVTSYSDLTGGEQSWTFTRESGGSASTGDTIYEGSVAIDYGTSGDSVIIRSVIGDNTPRDTQLTWTTNPTDANNYSIVTRTGILDDIDNASGAGFYSENAYLTNSILVGSLDRSGNYFEFDGTNINLEAGNASIGDTSGWFGASDILSYSDANGGEVGIAGFTAENNRFFAENFPTGSGFVTMASDNTDGTGGFSTDTTPAGVPFIGLFHSHDGSTSDRGTVVLGETLDGGWTNAFGMSFVPSKEGDAYFRVDRNISDGTLTAKIAGANFDAGAMWAGGDGTKANATFLADWANETLEMGSVFSADGGADEGRLASSYFDSTDLWGGNATKTSANIRLDFANSELTTQGTEGITTLSEGTFLQEKVTGNGQILIDALDSIGSRIDIDGESYKVVRFQEGSNPQIGVPQEYTGSTGGSANSLPSQPVSYIPIEVPNENTGQVNLYVIPVYDPASTPDTPTNVTLCSASSPDGIQISWDNMSVDEYEVQRAENSSGPWSTIGTTSSTSFLDSGSPTLQPDTTFYYRVRSIENGLTSGWSDVKNGSYNSLGSC